VCGRSASYLDPVTVWLPVYSCTVPWIGTVQTQCCIQSQYCITFVQNSVSLFPRSHIFCVHTLATARFAHYKRYKRPQQKGYLDKSTYTSLRRPSFHPFPRLDLCPTSLLPRIRSSSSFREVRTAQPHDIKHSIEYLPYFRGLPLDSYDLPRNIVSTRVLAIRVRLGLGHRIWRRWWPSAVDPAPPTFRWAFLSPLLYP
jgi:hypothetical protein